MNSIKKHRYFDSQNREEIRDMALEFSTTDYNGKPNCTAVTYTFKQGTGEVGVNYKGLTKDRCIQNLRHHLNILNKKTYNINKSGEQLRVFPVLERKPGERWHYHMAIENPFSNVWDFDMLLRNTWKKTDWGYNETDIKHNVDAGWLHYITKFENHDDTFDWQNYHN